MEIFKLSSKNKSCLSKIINFLKEGKIVIFPTDTVYGVLADVTDQKATERVFEIKKRPFFEYLPIFVKDIKTAKNLAKIGKKEEEFFKMVWPGRVTVVLWRKKGIQLYGVKKDTIALRIPNFEPLNYILEKLDFPLTATSANISGRSASGNIKEVLKQFFKQEDKPDFVVDFGNLPQKRPSTIVDLTKISPEILRV